MGFFSWECKICKRSILNEYTLSEFKNELDNHGWMKYAVFMFSNGTTMIGEYDGYGRINDMDMEHLWVKEEPCVYHVNCWEAAGKPEHRGASPNACDQGFFLDDIEYYQEMKNPLKEE